MSISFVSESYIDQQIEKAKEELERLEDGVKKYSEKGLEFLEKTEGGQSYKAQRAFFGPIRKIKEYIRKLKQQKMEEKQ